LVAEPRVSGKMERTRRNGEVEVNRVMVNMVTDDSNESEARVKSQELSEKN
jgi:hypothetical protein